MPTQIHSSLENTDLTTPLTSPLASLPGIAGRRKTLFERLLGKRIVDALLHLPTDSLYRRNVTSITETTGDEVITLIATVVEHVPPSFRGKPYRVVCNDGKTVFDLVFFKGRPEYLRSILPLNAQRVISGKAKHEHSRWKMIHPDHIGPVNTLAEWVGPEPVYPLTTGITKKCVTRVIRQGLQLLTNPSEQVPEWLNLPQNWPTWQEALRKHHFPKDSCIDLTSPERLRLAYDELLAHQLALNLMRTHHQHRQSGNCITGTGLLQQKILDALPFQLTNSQIQALQEIDADMKAPHQMLRLLQGDVGSGKTLVALFAMIQAIEAGYQTAFLAPTDILARQHALTLQRLVEPAGLQVTLLTGRDKGRARQDILDQLVNNQIPILIGTHAIIQDTVHFANLGLVIVDEQHRFGVDQRLALTQKGQNPDLLAMTATPIPRTLMLATYGDMDVSVLKEKPAGRQPISTKVMPISRLNEVIDALSRALHTNTKIYWVCPLVEESEVLDLAAAQERYANLSHLFGSRVGLVHGKMKAPDKDTVMDQFINGSVDILIATTVIEVGVDVPAATIMVIEHAERFGLAQLHQLRGRIGRGELPATCLLLYSSPLSLNGKKRLEIMRQTNDGFRISEEDLKIRGGGELLGTRQSGFPKFRLADFDSNPEEFTELLAMANKDARAICLTDPFLQSPRGQALRLLLRIFSKDEAIKYSRSG